MREPGCSCLGHLYLERDNDQKVSVNAAFGAAVKIVSMYVKHLAGKHGGYSLVDLRTDKDVIDVISTLTTTMIKRTMSLQLAVISMRTRKLPYKPSRDWRRIVNELMLELEDV